MSAAADAERALRRARRVITAQIAVAITLLVFIAGAVAYTIMVSGQHAEAERLLARTIGLGPRATPPGCVTLFTPSGHTLQAAVPPGAPLTASYARVPRSGDVFTERLDLGGMGYTVRTENHQGVVSQAFYEERYQQADRRSLLWGLAAAELLALFAALLTGRVLAGRAIRPLGEALRRQRTFVADASHELRAPLTRLHTRVQLLSRRARGAPIAAELDLLASGTRQLGEVIEDLLLSAQLPGGAAPRELVDLGALADAAVDAERLRADEHGLTVSVVRDAGPCYVVRGVPTALRRVLSALLDNAIEHTPRGGRIEVLLDIPDARHVQLAVRDTGEGFEQHQAQRLFERFARGSPGDGRGVGLGLALAREVVTGHGGTIAAAGAPGVGATFTLSFTSAAAGGSGR